MSGFGQRRPRRRRGGTAKVPSTSKLRNSFVAISFAAVLALTGCSDDKAAPSGASDGGGEQPAAASDGGGAPQPGGEQAMPEADTSDVPDVVAEVNGEDLQGRVRQGLRAPVPAGLDAAAVHRPGDEPGRPEEAGRQPVDNRLLLQAASDAGIKASDKDIDATLEDIAAQNGMGSAYEVVKALEQQGMSEDDVRKDAASQFTLTTYIEQEADIKKPSDEELKTQYDQEPSPSRSSPAASRARSRPSRTSRTWPIRRPPSSRARRRRRWRRICARRATSRSTSESAFEDTITL